MSDSCIVHWNAEIISEQGGNRVSLRGHTHDISLVGANVHTEEIFNSKAPVTLVMRIPKGKSIRDWGTVRVICQIVTVTEVEDHFRIRLHFQSFIDDGKKVLEEAFRERRVFNVSE